MSLYTSIDSVLKNLIYDGKRDFVIYPFSESGFLTKQILNTKYGIQEKFIIDKNVSKINSNVLDIDALDSMNCENIIFLVASKNHLNELKKNLLMKNVPEGNIVDCLSIEESKINFPVGKMCYGPLVEQKSDLIESIGAFCSFAEGTCIVENHLLTSVTTHPFVYCDDGRENLSLLDKIDIGRLDFNAKVTIGNDVWLGKNVIIQNGIKIGNGVIAGSGAVITKDVPDYAVVVGIPARIIRYRYTQEQIKILNEIKWWNWSNEKIKECYKDFYDINVFLEKHNLENNKN